MQNSTAKKEWEMYCVQELSNLLPILSRHGYTLDAQQPHLQGERYLMNAVTTTSGKKLILQGKNAEGIRVIIKASREQNGIREIEHERQCRDILTKIDFARDVFHTPTEMDYFYEHGYRVSIQEFIEQTSTFLDRPIEAQFSFALSAFKGQEGAHATTYKHRALITNTFGMRTAATYLDSFQGFVRNCSITIPHETRVLNNLVRAAEVLAAGRTVIEQYTGFLTHTDFVPHNIRIKENTIYLLDHSSLTFGNKYEGWARFINFMTLYNPPLQKALEEYVHLNRTEEESESLWLMRMYRLGEIIWYYVRTLEQSSDSLLELNTERVHFWNTVLEHILNRTELPQEVILRYKTRRDSLRTEDEKQRQHGLH